MQFALPVVPGAVFAGLRQIATPGCRRVWLFGANTCRFGRMRRRLLITGEGLHEGPDQGLPLAGQNRLTGVRDAETRRTAGPRAGASKRQRSARMAWPHGGEKEGRGVCGLRLFVYFISCCLCTVLYSIFASGLKTMHVPCKCAASLGEHHFSALAVWLFTFVTFFGCTAVRPAHCVCRSMPTLATSFTTNCPVLVRKDTKWRLHSSLFNVAATFPRRWNECGRKCNAYNGTDSAAAQNRQMFPLKSGKAAACQILLP